MFLLLFSFTRTIEKLEPWFWLKFLSFSQSQGSIFSKEQTKNNEVASKQINAQSQQQK